MCMCVHHEHVWCSESSGGGGASRSGVTGDYEPLYGHWGSNRDPPQERMLTAERISRAQESQTLEIATERSSELL